MVGIVINGRRVEVPEHTNVAAALLYADINVFRHTPVGAEPRAPYCMMGVCFDCLVEIDGLPNQQACMVGVRDGMDVKAMAGARALA